MRVKRWGLPLVVVALSAWAVGASCGDNDTRPTTPETIERPPPTLRLALITDLKGYLEPCGCTSRPLGGIDRMAAKVKAIRDQGKPTLVVTAGDLFFGSELVGVSREALETQEEWQAETLVDILNQLEVAAATPGALDFAHGRETFVELAERADFPLLAAGLELGGAEGTPNGGPSEGDDEAEQEGEAEGESRTEDATDTGPPRIFEDIRLKDMGGVKVGLFGVSAMEGPGGEMPDGVARTEAAREAAADSVEALKAQGAELVIGMVRGDRRLARRIAGGVDGIDFLVQAGLDRAEPIPPYRAGDTWVFHAGRQGQGLVVVDVWKRGDGAYADWSEWTREAERSHLEERISDLEDRIEAWEDDEGVAEADLARQRARLEEMRRELEGLRVPAEIEGNAFAATYHELPPDAARLGAIGERLDALYRRINEHNREAFADLKPPPLPEGEASYVGSGACQSCHEAEYTWWRGTPHGQAYETLVERHKQFNLSCVGCHVTGYMEPGGSTVTHLEDGALKDVGCEVCHGAGSDHVEEPEDPAHYVLDPPESVCVECHNPEHSDTFVYPGYRAMLLAPGHGMPTEEERAAEGSE